MRVNTKLDANLFPVFGNVKRPLKLQVSLVIVIHEFRDCFVVASCHHSSWRFVRSNYTPLAIIRGSAFDFLSSYISSRRWVFPLCWADTTPESAN